MLSRFFIERPRFAFVISIVITLAGLVALFTLPVNQYPNITPGQVNVTATYPGADAKTVQETVVEPIEAQINGVKRLLYISSTSTNTGSATVTATYDIATDGDLNTVNTQNRVNWANGQLPDEVRRQTVIVKEKSPSMLLVIALHAGKGGYDSLFLNNYASINIKDELARIPGVGDVTLLSELKYSMRIWLDADRMASLKMPVSEVTTALQNQNVQVSAGALGDAPTGKNQEFRYSLQTRGRLSTPEEFGDIIVRSTSDGAQVKLRDVAKIELGSENYSTSSTYNGKPAALLAIYQLNSGNGIAIAEACRARLKELKAYFPPGIDVAIPFDTTSFINASIDEVKVTLYEAVALVILITFLFLQNWRATLIPTVAIPVSLIGTFAVMAVIGYSINLITLFGLILAIGIVVDDAIVVIENVSRLMEEEHLDPKAAAIKSMEQVTGPVVATTAVLLAMFVPICFLPGITGEMYRQFGVTISVAVTLSSINALTLSPALSALVMKPGATGGSNFFIFRWFNKFFDRLTAGYTAVSRRIIRRSFVMLLLFGALIWGCAALYNALPTGFIPAEDQGEIFIEAQLPDAASLPRTQALVNQLEEKVRKVPGVKEVMAIPGYSILSGAISSNSGLLIVSLNPWSERKGEALSQDGVIRRFRKIFRDEPGAVISAFGMPTIPGIGTTGGFSFVIEDTTGTWPERLERAVQGLCAEAKKRPEIQTAFSPFRATTPQLFLRIDREKARKTGVSLDKINTALQGLTGYTYVNDFNKFGKVYKVEIQAQRDQRRTVENIRAFRVRNDRGEMVPLGTLLEVERRTAPQYLNRFNLYSSATITGMPAPGYSSGQAMAAMEEVAKKHLPLGMKYDWTDMSYQEKAASAPLVLGPFRIPMIAIVFALALLFMYLFLVAQYESWMIPAAVLMSVPVAFFGALAFLWFGGVDNNLYTQVGFILLFGLACKTAILIVEFARVRHDAGLPVEDAALEAAKLRFRAVLMTALSFVLGVTPLVTATGAGAASRLSLGTAVFGGMLVAAVGGTLLIPSFYVVVQRVIDGARKK